MKGWLPIVVLAATLACEDPLDRVPPPPEGQGIPYRTPPLLELLSPPDAPTWDKPPVWIHGDLAPGNLLAVDGKLTALIDWGGLGVGDPATDLLPAWNLLEGESRDALSGDDATWARGRGHALS